MEIKTAEEIIYKIPVNDANLDYIKQNGKINGSLHYDIKRAMKEYASQFIDLAAEEADVEYRGHSFGDYIVDKQSILSIKELINKEA